VNKINRCTEFQFYRYYDCTCFGQPFCPSSRVLSRTSALVHFMQLWWPFAIRSSMELLDFQFYWYYDSTCFGQPFCPSSGVLSCTSTLVHFMQLWWPFATRSRMELKEFHPTSGSKRSSQLHKVYQSRRTAKNSWWWAERLPETCRVVIPIKLEFSVSVGFIHKKSVTMRGQTSVKYV